MAVAPLKTFLGNSRQALNRQLTGVPEKAELLKRFDTRSAALLQKVPALPPSAAKLQADLQRLVNFRPEDSLPEGIEALMDRFLWMFIPDAQQKVKRLMGMVFFLGTLRDLPIFGPFVGASMDIVSGYLPVLASTVQTTVPNLVGLLPIPYAAFAGEAVAYAISAMMMFFNVMTTASQGEFDEAAITILGLVPVLGPNLMNFVTKGQRIYEKLEENKEAILTSIEEIRGVVLLFLPTAIQFVGKENLLNTLDALANATRAVVAQAETRMIDGSKKVGGGRWAARAAATAKRRGKKTRKH